MLICNNVSIVVAWGVFQPIIHTPAQQVQVNQTPRGEIIVFQEKSIWKPEGTLHSEIF